MQHDYDFYLFNGMSFRLSKELIDDFEQRYGSAAAVEIARLVCDSYGLKPYFDDVYTILARFFKSKEKHWVLIEFQNYINHLYEENRKENDGTRFGFNKFEGMRREEEIRVLERDMFEFLKSKGYYE